MSSFKCKTGNVKRLPLTDATNITLNSSVIPKRSPGRPRKTSSDHLKFTPNSTIIPKTHPGTPPKTSTDQLNITGNLSVTPKRTRGRCGRYINHQIISNDSKISPQQLVFTDSISRELPGLLGCNEGMQNSSVNPKRPRGRPPKTQTDNLISSDHKRKLQVKVCNKNNKHQIILNDPKLKDDERALLEEPLEHDGSDDLLKPNHLALPKENPNRKLRSAKIKVNSGEIGETKKNRDERKNVDLKLVVKIKRCTELEKMLEHAGSDSLSRLRHPTLPTQNPKLKYAEETFNTKSVENSKTRKSYGTRKNGDKKLVAKINRCAELEKSLEPDKRKKIAKNVRFADNVVPKEKELRKRRSVNYTESSFQDSFEQKANKQFTYQEHIPVYLQNVNEQQTKVKDPFEFTSNSPTKKTYKGRRRKQIQSPLHSGQFKKRIRGRPQVEVDSDSDSEPGLYDKSMHEVLQEIRKKVDRPKIKNNKHVKQLTNRLKLENNIRGNIKQIVPHTNDIQQKLAKNFNDLIWNNKVVPRNLHNEIISVENEAKQGNANKLAKENTNGLRNGLSNVEAERTRASIGHGETQLDDCDMYFGFDDDCQSSDDDISSLAPGKQGLNMQDKFCKLNPIAGDAFYQLTSLTSTPLPNTQRPNTKAVRPNQATNSKKLNIISNVLISPPRSQQASIQTQPTTSKPRSENSLPSTVGHSKLSVSNSTALVNSVASLTSSSRNQKPDSRKIAMKALGSRISDNISSPWRSTSLNLKRNPHFLQLKDTSLPRYNQEVIMKSKMDERASLLKRLVQNDETVNMVQTSILDFLSGDLQSTPIKKSHNRTLFDETDFSPIQSNEHKESSVDKTGDADNVMKSQNHDGKRNLFGTPKKSKCLPLKPKNNQDGNTNEELGVMNYFGFDLPDDSWNGNNKENNRPRRSNAKYNKKRSEHDLPMRVHLKQIKKVQNEVIEVLLDEMNFNKTVAEEPPLQQATDDASHTTGVQDDNLPIVGLFEDLVEVKPAQRVYVSKRTKRFGIPSVHCEDSQEEAEEKPKRKRKDMRTQVEEEEFEKWAAEFNAMCEEVDKHSLETT